MHSYITSSKISSVRCHHYGIYAHTRPFCYKLYGYPKSYSQPRPKGKKEKNTHAKKKCKPKEIISCFIAHTSLRVSSREDWYFDSGFSKHVTREKTYLKELKSYYNSYVIFGDGAKGIT